MPSMPATPHDLSRLRIDRTPAARRGGGCGLWIVVAMLVLLFGGYVAWKEGLVVLQDERPLVSVGRVRRAGEIVARSGVAANGYIVARRRAALSTDVQGRIEELFVEEGDRVAQGDVIARLDTRQLQASRLQAVADLARAELASERLELDRRRFATLLADGDVNEADADRSRLLHEEALAAEERQRSRIAELDVLIENSSVFAPFAGVITAKNAEVGEVVSAIGGSGPNARGAVATLVDFATLEVQVELSQASLDAARDGAPVDVFLDAYPDHRYSGRVRQIWPTANRQKATVELRVELLDLDDRVLPEMGVRVLFVEDTEQDGPVSEPRVLVPEAALVGPEDRRSVFLVTDGVVSLRAVSVEGDAEGGLRAVTDGLAGNERVVLSPPEGLTDGAAVRLE